MLVVTRITVPESDGERFLTRARGALDAFAACRGYRGGRIGRSTDDATLWILSTEWEGAGAYRRALSSYDVKVHAVPVMMMARDEPSAFEILVTDGAEDADVASGGAVRRPRRAADAATVAVGEASGPDVATGFERRSPGGA